MKRLFFFALFALVALIAASGYLYNNLKDKSDTTNLVVYDQTTKSPLTTSQPPQNETGSPTENDPSSSGGSGNAQAQKPEPTIPNFTVYDKDGNPVELHDLIGKPIVLNFWASWCGPCKSEMPDFEAKYRELGGEVLFVMINLTDGYYETVSSASKFIANNGYTFPVYFDTESSAAIAYNVLSIPTTYFIDKDGNIVAHATGMLSEEALSQGIDMIKGSE